MSNTDYLYAVGNFVGPIPKREAPFESVQDARNYLIAAFAEDEYISGPFGIWGCRGELDEEIVEIWYKGVCYTPER